MKMREAAPFMIWDVYIILCSDDSLYTGITTDISRRYRQHDAGKGAKYFRGRRPLRVVYREEGHTRSSAGKREVEIKSLSRDGKIALITSANMTNCTMNDDMVSCPCLSRR